jgi:hypothetical protein
LPPVSLIPVPLFATGVVDSGKLAANLQLVLLTPEANLPPVSTPAVAVANLPPVSWIPVVHLNLQISPGIKTKIRNDFILILEAWEKMIHKKPESKKSRDIVPLRLAGMIRQ